MNVFFTADCPYCGHRNKFTMEKEGMIAPIVKMAIYTCDIEEGGCDQPFVVGLKLEPVVTIKAIEGYYSVPSFSEIEQEEINDKELATHTLPGE